MNNYCAACGKNLEGLGFKCRYCGEYFCIDHQLPENHSCQDLEDWKSGKLKKFKKDVKVPEEKRSFKLLEIPKKNKWMEFLLVILGVGMLVLVLRMLS